MQGRYYTLNDSGNEPDLFLIDSSGRSYGSGWRVPGAKNRDWEALSVGRCPAGSCVYIADTGDNQERYPTVVVYRTREPANPTRFLGQTDTLPLELDSLVLHYADHPHDLEAIYLDDEGTLYLISKGRTEGILLFRVPPSAWDSSAVVTPELLQKLPIQPDHAAGRWVTDAARSPDGKRVVVRTYTELYFFDFQPDGHLAVPKVAVVCLIGGLEPQGEGIDWVDGKRMILTSESAMLAAGPLHLVECSTN